MESHSEINGLSPATLRFLFDGCRIHYDDTPDFVSLKYLRFLYLLYSICLQIYIFFTARNGRRRYYRLCARENRFFFKMQ